MGILHELYREFLQFFRIEGLLDILKSRNFKLFLTHEGLLALLAPVPLAIIGAELIYLLFSNWKNRVGYKIPFYVILLNRLLGRLLGLSVLLLCMTYFKKYAIIETSVTWYWIIYGYLVYELSTYTRHYLSHKVRLMWCCHSVHHSPQTLNSSITLTTAFIEDIYTELFAGIICTVLGVQPLVMFTVMILDAIWGAVVHMSEDSFKNGRFGFLEKIILTPSHHRVHHASNDIYMDTNFCSIISIWDRLFGTYQEEKYEVPIKYGTTRDMDSTNFMDVYFIEFIDLWNDVKNAKSLKNKLLYIIMPPGWSPEGELMTAKILRNKALGK